MEPRVASDYTETQVSVCDFFFLELSACKLLIMMAEG